MITINGEAELEYIAVCEDGFNNSPVGHTAITRHRVKIEVSIKIILSP